MANLNRFQFIGNLTRDAEIRYTGNKTAVATISLAVNDTWRDNEGNKQEKANFFRIKVWGKLGENAHKYLGKGSSVLIEGRIESTEYVREGQTEKTYGTDFVAENVQYLATKAPALNTDAPQ